MRAFEDTRCDGLLNYGVDWPVQDARLEVRTGGEEGFGRTSASGHRVFQVPVGDVEVSIDWSSPRSSRRLMGCSRSPISRHIAVKDFGPFGTLYVRFAARAQQR